MTATERAFRLAQTLGLPVLAEIITAISAAITEAELQARLDERRHITADWLTETLPPEVLQLAADKITGRTF